MDESWFATRETLIRMAKDLQEFLEHLELTGPAGVWAWDGMISANSPMPDIIIAVGRL